MKHSLPIAASLLLLSATLPAATFQVDFGISGVGQTTIVTGWNNMETATAGNNPADLTNIVDSTNSASTIDIAYTESSTNAGVSGTPANYTGVYPALVASQPATALQDGIFFQSGTTVTLVISGLDTNLSYNFLLYGARGNNGGDAIYTANGANSGNGTISNVFSNATQTVTITGISPTAAGVINLVLSQSASPAGAGSINLMVFSATATADADSDGMPDPYETANGTNPNVNDANLDKDSDGLSNIQEFLGHNASNAPTGYGQTRSGTADTDSDGPNDYQEITGSLNPWTGNVLGSPPGDSTNPNLADSDDDGVSDGSEITSGSNPNAKPPNSGPTFPFVDTDGDSYRDGAETAFGSNPNDPASCPNHSALPKKPNVVIIYADDMGLGDISAYGNLFGTNSPADTPRMDALAAQGVLFTQAHSSNGVCTPSRYALLTGKYNWRLFNGITNEYGWESGTRAEVPKLSDTTLAEYLKTKGYDTAAFGKWHLGGNWYYQGGNTRVTGNPNTPTTIDWARPVENHAVDHGFDVFRGLACTINRGPYVYLEGDRNQFWDASLNGGAGGFRNATNSDSIQWLSNIGAGVVPGGAANTPSLGDPHYKQIDAEPLMITQVEEYMAERFATSDPDPFFAYVSLYSPHLPWAITPEFLTGTNDYYADFMREVDHRIGRVLDAIDNNGFHDNTVVILTSDNGPETTAMNYSLPRGQDPNGPLRGAKRDSWDGGTRVPFVVRWPGQAAAGMKTGELIWQGDVFATIAAHLHDELPNDVAPDGESFLNIIRGQQKPATRRDSTVVSSINGHLGLKTTDGWKLIDSTGGGGNSTTWDSANATISGAIGTDKGTPKQLFQQTVDLGEDDNLISSLTSNTQIRNELTSLTGRDLLAILDQYRTSTTAQLFPRRPDNDADGMPNSFEVAHGFDPDNPKDASGDLDGDGQSNLAEFVAGTDPTNALSLFRVLETNDTVTGFSVTWPSNTGRSYDVYWTSNFSEWHYYSQHAGTGGILSETLDKATMDAVDGIPGNLTRCFVRVTASES